MTKQCSAYAISREAQCKNKAIPGSPYCWRHIAKIPLIISAILAILSAIFGVVAFEFYRSIVPSDELQQLKTASKDLKDLRESIEPVVKLATEKYPALDMNTALSKLADDIQSLQKQNFELRKDIKNISDKLEPILAYSRAKFPEKNDEEALKLILDEIRKLSNLTLSLKARTLKLDDEIQSVKQYSDVASWGFWGDIETGGGVNFSSPVSRWTEKYVSEQGGNVSWQCNSDALMHYKGIIDKYPKYPFPYVLLSLCLKKADDPSWRKYANEGYEILTKTTSIAKHAPSHDQALEMLKKAMQNDK